MHYAPYNASYDLMNNCNHSCDIYSLQVYKIKSVRTHDKQTLNIRMHSTTIIYEKMQCIAIVDYK